MYYIYIHTHIGWKGMSQTRLCPAPLQSENLPKAK